MARKLKDHKMSAVRNDLHSIEAYREVPWVQTWAKHTFDFKRWLYLGRPVLEKHGNGGELVLAERNDFVKALRNAVWNIANVTDTTKKIYCQTGLVPFFEYLDYRYKRLPILGLEQIDQTLLEEYLYWLRYIRQTKTGSLSELSMKSIYTNIKVLLQHLINQQVLSDGIFPENPFPNSHRMGNKRKPYPKEVMGQLLKGLARDIRQINDGVLKLAPKDVLAVYLFVIAALTGRNPSSLMSMDRDALEPHPINPNMSILKVFKNRGYTNSVQAFRVQEKVEDVVSVSMGVVSLFHLVDGLTAHLVKDAPAELKNKLWLYRIATTENAGAVVVFERYQHNAKLIVERHQLKDIDGKVLTLNISRLRATFIQRMWSLAKGDLARTAFLAGNTPSITDRHYLEATPEMAANHRRLGHLMHAELAGNFDNPEELVFLSREMGISKDQLVNIFSGKNNTGIGRCVDPLNGKNAPGGGVLCSQWLACFQCPDLVVMEADLYRLYSFYFLLIKERSFLKREHWEDIYGPIVQIIDNEIVGPNMRTAQNPTGCFDPLRVKKMREKAEQDPDAMWRYREILAMGDVSG